MEQSKKNAEALQNQYNQVIGITCYVKHIATSKKLELELQQCKEQLKNVQQQAVALKKQYDGKIVDC